MENVQKKIHHLPIVTTKDPQGPWVAQAMAQLVTKVDGIWVDGVMQDLEPCTYTVGAVIRQPLADRAGDANVAFRVKTLRGSDAEPQVMLLGADVVQAVKASSLIIHPGDSLILQVQPQVHGRAKRFKFLVEALCGTCRGSGTVGYPGHQVICPICKEDPAFVMKPLLGKQPAHRLFLNDLKIGMRSQFLGAGPIPLKALEDTNLVMDVCYVGQFIILDITNGLNAPVRLSGEVLFEEVEIKHEDEKAKNLFSGGRTEIHPEGDEP